MTTYEVTVTELLRRTVTVEADCMNAAIDNVQLMYNNGEIVLDYNDFDDYDVNCTGVYVAVEDDDEDDIVEADSFTWDGVEFHRNDTRFILQTTPEMVTAWSTLAKSCDDTELIVTSRLCDVWDALKAEAERQLHDAVLAGLGQTE